MAEKFKDLYRNGTFRAQWWDFGWNGAYYLTICTKNREQFFGKIENNKMLLSNVGVIASVLWNEIPNHHDYIKLGDFVVMPNHIHGIIIINKPNMSDDCDIEGSGHSVVGSWHALNLQLNEMHKQLPGSNRFQNIGKNTLSSVIGSYKSAVTKYANRFGYPNGWQSLFYERIIRDESEYKRISNYIISNPENWKGK